MLILVICKFLLLKSLPSLNNIIFKLKLIFCKLLQCAAIWNMLLIILYVGGLGPVS